MRTARSIKSTCLALSFVASSGVAAQQVDRNELYVGQSESSYVAPDMPHVSCKNGSLSVSADHATMLSVLSALNSCPGILMEIPNNLPNELSYIRLGPGPLREVLEILLPTLPFDFVIQPIPGGDNRLRVLLFDRLVGGTTLAEVSPSDPVLQRRVAGPARAAFLMSHEGHPSDSTAATYDKSLETEQLSDANEKAAGVTEQSPAHMPGNGPEALEAKDAPGSVTSTTDHGGSATGELVPKTEATDPAAMELKKKILDMQRMFEIRKQLGTPASADISH